MRGILIKLYVKLQYLWYYIKNPGIYLKLRKYKRRISGNNRNNR
jgi:hypothetical protein